VACPGWLTRIGMPPSDLRCLSSSRGIACMRAQRCWLGFWRGEAYRAAAGGRRWLGRRRYGLEDEAHPGNAHAEAGVACRDDEVFATAPAEVGNGDCYGIPWITNKEGCDPGDVSKLA
jgi:hypothetical protein